jgi:hypothetical protein
MLMRRLALGLFFGVPLFVASAFGQTAPAQSPIVCGIEDNVEDATCQKKLKDLITRKGDTLIVGLDGGKSKTYVSNLAACDGENADPSKCIAFYVLSYFPQTRSYLIAKSYDECGDYRFVSRHTGSEITMSAIPVISPNGKYLLSIDASDGCDRKYDIAIWSLQTDPPKLEFKYQAKQYENWEVTAWQDDTHIRVKAFINGKAPHDQEAELLRTGSSWALQLGEKVDHPIQIHPPRQSSIFPIPPAGTATVNQHELPKCSLSAGIPGITCSN